MTQNMISVGSIKQFSEAVKSHGVDLIDDNVKVVKNTLEQKADVSLASSSDFIGYIRGLGLTSKDVAVVTAEELMQSTSEQKVKTNISDLTSSKKLKR